MVYLWVLKNYIGCSLLNGSLLIVACHKPTNHELSKNYFGLGLDAGVRSCNFRWTIFMFSWAWACVGAIFNASSKAASACSYLCKFLSAIPRPVQKLASL